MRLPLAGIVHLRLPPDQSMISEQRDARDGFVIFAFALAFSTLPSACKGMLGPQVIKKSG